MTDKIQVDCFQTETFDGVPVELEAVLSQDVATLRVPGYFFRHRVSVILPKDEAFRVYHNACVMTWKEFLDEVSFR